MHSNANKPMSINHVLQNLQNHYQGEIMNFLKGYRTVIFNVATIIVALSEMTDLFNIIVPGSGPIVLLAVGIANLVLRFLTTTPIGVSGKSEV